MRWSGAAATLQSTALHRDRAPGGVPATPRCQPGTGPVSPRLVAYPSRWHPTEPL